MEERKIRIIYIVWEDPTWCSNKHIDSEWSLMIQKTAGILGKEDNNYIRVILNVDENNIGDYIDIPKDLILVRKVIELDDNKAEVV
ncbi:MAG: hypothetical protein RMJ67_10165 [Elusimicrobiota bacterium]|nr:hypothetical protein [Endomicrobiia bacterium]MDW8166856.1 hypothetical protein [Elusimicrobiota bacterium]